MRPVPLHARPNEWRSWGGFAGVATAFLAFSDWKDRRNKVIALREALRKGPGAVEQFRSAYELAELPVLDNRIADLQEKGWGPGHRCGYFDAVEALDFFLPTEEQ